MKVKVISASPANLGKSITEWMYSGEDGSNKNPDIKLISQSESQGIVTVTIFYM